MDSATSLAITSSAITAAASRGAASTVAYFGHKNSTFTSELAKKVSEIEELKAELQRAYRQVAAYHEIENLCAERIAANSSTEPKTVKTELRNKVEELGCERPKFTRAECEKRILGLGTQLNR